MTTTTSARSRWANHGHAPVRRMIRCRPRRRTYPLRRVLLGRASTLIAAALLAALIVACDGSPATSTPLADYAHAERLVSPAWVESHLGDPSLVIVDLRSQALYSAGHVPGARQVAVSQLQATDSAGVPSQLVSAAAMAGILENAGITPDRTVIFYDDQGSLWAAWALWSLDVYGHADSRIMNGTWTLWESEHRPVSNDTPAVQTTAYRFTAIPDASIVTDFQGILDAVKDPSKVVCDARSAGEYVGTDVRSAHGGHIPGAINVEWSKAVASNGQFLPVRELTRLYADAGVWSADGTTVFTYCQTGVRGAHTWFVLHELLGYSRVALYDGSWAEYGSRDGAPIETGTVPAGSTGKAAR